MPLQLILLSVMFLGFILAVMVGVIVSGERNLQMAAQLGVIFSPVALAVFLGIRRYWFAIGVGLIPLIITFPVAFLNRFPLSIWFSFGVLACIIGAACMKQYQRPVLSSIPGFLLTLCFLIMLGRILYDRPGMATMGAGEGGARQAFMYIAALPAFWAYSKCAAEDNWKITPVLWVLFLLLAFAFVHRMVFSGILGRGGGEDDVQSGIFYNLYSRPGWLLYSLLLAWVIFYFQIRKKTFWFNILLIGGCAAILGFSVLSGHRRTLLFAMGTVGLITYIYRYHGRSWFFVGAGGIIGLLVMLQLGPDLLPGMVRRSVSLVIPISEAEQQQIRGEVGSSEFGFENEFRKRLYARAMEDIQANPFFGSGFTFETEELMKLYTGADPLEERIDRLSATGAFHNCLLTIAAFSGLPAAIFFTLGSLWLLGKATYCARRCPDPMQKLLLVALIGMVPPLYGHMVLNGAGQDFFRTCLILGVINGLIHHPRFRQGRKKLEPEAESTAGMEPVEISEPARPVGAVGMRQLRREILRASRMLSFVLPRPTLKLSIKSSD